jgi:hypothetical protein
LLEILETEKIPRIDDIRRKKMILVTLCLSGGPPAASDVGVAGFGVVDLPSSELFFGAGVEDCELELPWGLLMGDFFLSFIPMSTPFSLGGLLRIPFITGPFSSFFIFFGSGREWGLLPSEFFGEMEVLFLSSSRESREEGPGKADACDLCINSSSFPRRKS